MAQNAAHATAIVERSAGALSAAVAEHRQALTTIETQLGSMSTVLDDAVADCDRAIHHEILTLEDAARSPAEGQGKSTSPSRDHWRPALAHVLRPASKELASLVDKLLDDAAHALGVVKALHLDEVQLSTILILRRLASGRTLGGRNLEATLRAIPGSGPLFEPVHERLDRARRGGRIMNAFIDAASVGDPVRTLSGRLRTDQIRHVVDYVRRLRATVEPTVDDEIRGLVTDLNGVAVNTRIKGVNSLIEKVRRRAADNAKRAGVPGFTVGHVADAVGARVIAPDVRMLSTVFRRVLDHFGTNRGGRILSLENLYVAPRPYSPALRAVTANCRITVDGLRYPFELQMVTRHAILAADLDHNTVYKPYVLTTPGERELVRRMLEEATALDQLESRGTSSEQ